MAIDSSIPVLVVDHNKAMIKIVRNLLKQLDFEDVDDAGEGDVALGKLKERKYGLVICDLHISKHVRADESLKNLPFIMMTEESNAEKLTVAKKTGVNTYIIKPFNAQTLKGKIETEMKNRRRLVRHRILKRGQLAYDQGAHTEECLVRDISLGGARIQVANAQHLPAELVLSLEDGGAPRSCLVRWRSHNAVGIEFIDSGSDSGGGLN